MIKILHPIAGILAFLTILTFWLSTVAVELGGDPVAIASVKLGILWGLLLLIPAIATAGATGFRLGGRSQRPDIMHKRRRMPIIALNGILVLVPCAIVLQQRASAGQFDATFTAIQGLELMAGAVNLVLLGLNIRDGFRLSRRFGMATT
ncbi:MULTISPECIES: hypothetical protein [Rhodopseudomonas]|uniref:Membrane protein n=1 Tax=Rhodopseudomonas palustris TaxID=1076 RepID=A0A0D7EKW1_RHOPL|nr:MULTISPECIES: hypothetical protein [Rhodopseudomonas]KIZ41474.1 membrane protein [Rhodopseudomonas palustris]MDF3812436.1 hypothetical protein [Rhodopseudomonas sp. BAL398]WOK19435.1 hypothetical protein RBJ75_07950 [Rhodopseudomonas sp. BAL398]